MIYETVMRINKSYIQKRPISHLHKNASECLGYTRLISLKIHLLSSSFSAFACGMSFHVM